MLEILFWTLIAVVAWCYAGYPLFIAVQARVRPRAIAATPALSRPTVTVVIAVRNERPHLERRVENLLAQIYPSDRIRIVLACNGSTDGSEAIARELARRDCRVRVVVSPAAEGKAGALNMGVALATSALIVFADARQTFALDAVARLVEPFGDPTVGAVTGRLVVQRADLVAVEGVRLYWGLETRLRAAESRSGSVVGATGAIYAIRRALFPGVPGNLILDDVYIPLRIAIGGRRIVMAADAIAHDVPAQHQRHEFARKRRTMVGNIQLVSAVPGVLSPRRNPLLIRFVSHKLLRVLSPFCFVALLFVSATLSGPLYRAFFYGELALYVLGAVGLRVSLRALSLPSAFVLVHAAVFAAVWRWRDDASQVWTHAAPESPLTAVRGADGRGVSAPETLAPIPVHLPRNV